jgi:hypothetical protein
MLVFKEWGCCDWDVLGALGLLDSYSWIAILPVLDACNGRGAYFLTKAGSLTESGLYTASGFTFNMFSSSILFSSSLK